MEISGRFLPFGNTWSWEVSCGPVFWSWLSHLRDKYYKWRRHSWKGWPVSPVPRRGAAAGRRGIHWGATQKFWFSHLRWGSGNWHFFSIWKTSMMQCKRAYCGQTELREGSNGSHRIVLCRRMSRVLRILWGGRRSWFLYYSLLGAHHLEQCLLQVRYLQWSGMQWNEWVYGEYFSGWDGMEI